MGENGAGKTTLLKMMAGALAPDAGEVTIGASRDDGLLRAAPDGAARRRPHRPRGAAGARADRPAIGTLRSLAGRVRLPAATTWTSRCACCRAARRRALALAKILYDAPNLLVLDEPTNHLDIVTKRALVSALADYEGTSSSCRTTAPSCARSRRACSSSSPAGPRVYGGSYDEYVASTGREAPGMRQA